jgi:hypothetical protein
MARPTTKNIEIENSNPIGLPITFSQFVKNPLMGLLFIGILLLFYLVYDMKSTINRQEYQIQKLETEVRENSRTIAELKQENGSLKAELQTRKELNNIR